MFGFLAGVEVVVGGAHPTHPGDGLIVGGIVLAAPSIIKGGCVLGGEVRPFASTPLTKCIPCLHHTWQDLLVVPILQGGFIVVTLK